MKIWLLYSNPYDDGDEVYGAFSTEDKASKAAGIFQTKANHPLFIRELDIDELEKFFDKASSPCRFYVGWKIGNKWDFSPVGLESFLDRNKLSHTILKTGGLSATVYAKCEEDAELIANELFIELEQQPEDERGWKWLEKFIS